MILNIFIILSIDIVDNFDNLSILLKNDLNVKLFNSTDKLFICGKCLKLSNIKYISSFVNDSLHTKNILYTI